jgi:hypothetical protein
MDAAHWRAQVDARTDPAGTWKAMCHDVEQVLGALHAVPLAPVTAACYLLSVWTRYRHDAAESATPALRARAEWLSEVARAAVPGVKEAGQ